MSQRFLNKVAIITGSSSGIGRATAVLFAQEGAKVVVTGRNVEQLEETKKQVLAVNKGVEANVVVVAGDITLDDFQQTLLDKTLEAFHEIHVLVNNAGARISDGDANTGMDANIDVLKKTLDLNLISVIKLSKLIKPHLAKTHGEIVNISSVVAKPFAFEHGVFYSASKAALDQWTRSTAVNYAREGIRVNSVNPGLIRTNFMANTGLPDEIATKIYDSFESSISIPRGKVGGPEEIATVIAFLADRSQSANIIGQTIVADGGATLLLAQSVALSK